MPRVPKVIPVSDEEYAAQKAAKAERSQRFLVTGDSKIRDAIDRESKVKGEYVWLDPEETVIVLLERAKLVKAAPADAPKAEAKAGKAS